MERAPLLLAADVVAVRLAATVGPAARFLLDHHLAAGDFCVLLSSSPRGAGGADRPASRDASIAGHPVAVNPDRMLRRVAHQEGWPILVLG
jgi:phosphoserine phosphatase